MRDSREKGAGIWDQDTPFRPCPRCTNLAMNVAFAPASDTIAAGKIWLRMIEGREIAIDPYLPGDVLNPKKKTIPFVMSTRKRKSL